MKKCLLLPVALLFVAAAVHATGNEPLPRLLFCQSATAVLTQAPDPARFRTDFLTALPEIKEHFENIKIDQLSGDIEEGDSLLPALIKLTGTSNINYQSLVDGLSVTYDVTLRASIGKNLNVANATKTTDEWKAMLLAAFPEDTQTLKESTATNGDRFVTITHLANPKNKYSEGWNITIQNWEYKGKRIIDLVISYKRDG